MNNFKSIILKLVIIFGIAAIFFVGWSVHKEIERKKDIQKEIEKLQKEAERINKENLNISQKISYLESSDYKEREAKEKLNLKSPDENVVIIKPSPSQKNSKDSSETQKITNNLENKPQEKNNPEKWWTYLFDYGL